MASIRKKRRNAASRLLWIYVLLCVCIYVLVNVFMNSSNNSLAVDIQSKKEQIEALKVENQQLDVEIQTLRNKDRIYTIAKESGLEQIQNNIINIKESDINEAK